MVKVSAVLMPIKFILMMMQFILVVLVATTRSEYIYEGIPTLYGLYSEKYNKANNSILAGCLIFIILLFLEFFTLIFGVSLMFNKVNAFQIVFHFVGCLATIWMILNQD